MPNNPFVNCKSRKRRKARIPTAEPKEKLFCPRTMVRYDNSVSQYKTIWVCKMCLVSLLSEQTVKEHIINCNDKSNKAKAENKPVEKNEDTDYICEFCCKVFSRNVNLKKHLEEHQNSPISVDSD